MSPVEIVAVLGVTFAACAVEAVEALTVVLAIGVTRGWRSTWLRTAARLVGLRPLVAVVGPALARLPLDALRLVVGGVLLVFGLQWLRKAVLRAAGVIALRDEEAAYRRTYDQAKAERPGRSPAAVWRGGVDDGYAFT